MEPTNSGGKREPVFLEPGYQASEGIVRARGRIIVAGRHGAGNSGLWTGRDWLRREP